MVPFSQGKAGGASRGSALSNLVVFLSSQEQMKCNNKKQMQKKKALSLQPR